MYCYKVINELDNTEIIFSKNRYARRYILNEIYLKADDDLRKDKEFFMKIKNELKKYKKIELNNFIFSIQECKIYSEGLVEELYELLNN